MEMPHSMATLCGLVEACCSNLGLTQDWKVSLGGTCHSEAPCTSGMVFEARETSLGSLGFATAWAEP